MDATSAFVDPAYLAKNKKTIFTLIIKAGVL